MGRGRRAHSQEPVCESLPVRAPSRELVCESLCARDLCESPLREPSARALCESPSARAPPSRVVRGWVVGGSRAEGASARACLREPACESPFARACLPCVRDLCESSPQEPLRELLHESPSGWVVGGSQVGCGRVAGEREQEEEEEQQQQAFCTVQPPTNALRDLLLHSGTQSL